VVKKDNTQPALHVGLDDVDPARPLATLIASNTDFTPGFVDPPSTRAPEATGPPLSSVRPVRKRKFYFSEKVLHPDDLKSPTLFFITEEGLTLRRRLKCPRLMHKSECKFSVSFQFQRFSGG
jgi:hypothetical protein